MKEGDKKLLLSFNGKIFDKTVQKSQIDGVQQDAEKELTRCRIGTNKMQNGTNKMQKETNKMQKGTNKMQNKI